MKEKLWGRMGRGKETVCGAHMGHVAKEGGGRVWGEIGRWMLSVSDMFLYPALKILISFFLECIYDIPLSHKSN